ncbi:MAG: hypothetical protein LUH82_02655 [Clostridiales bacterium]|nr:hypothetical protein [Clostridiales bacterium]
MKLKRAFAILAGAFMLVAVFAACSSAQDTEITASDAVNLIKTYTAEELGVDGELDDYSVLSSSDQEVDGESYYKIAIAIVSEPEEDGSVDLDIHAIFYVSYDGETILAYDEETGEYTEFEDVHEVPTTEAPTDTYEDADEEDAQDDSTADASAE